ncbi:zinc finger protein OZF-like [Macrosteles quadrilineatus]|uniref:zinc finger protein OZF-like n=1 Tax=Macrosteles quadrilineatus TaxID=74068 RepID=UPI0023E124EA|nr:zinc finger protein OZF-like [Macrosteles quadrilineatus]
MTITEGGKFKCDVCGRRYSHKRSLNLHARLECGKTPQFACLLCPYRAKRKSTLQSHMVFKHSSCDTLPALLDAADFNQRYKHKCSVGKHKKYECGQEARFKCPACPYRSFRKGQMVRHTSRYHKELFNIFRRYVNTFRLFNHNNAFWRPHVHLRFKYLIFYNYCLLLICHVLLDTIKEWIQVQLLPDGSATYGCKKCSKVYKHETSVYKHLKFECGQEPKFQCHLCPYKSKQAGNMRTHLAMKHGHFKK